MKKSISDEAIKHIVERLLEKFETAAEESRKNKQDPFYSARELAYYEMLDVLRTEIDVNADDLAAFGLDVDLEKMM